MVSSNNPLIAPVVKWVGGKRQLFENFKPLFLDKLYRYTYCEPFLGGGAIFFKLQPNKAYVNDINEDLIRVYEVIRDDVDKLIATLSTFTNDTETFYAVKNLDRDMEKFSQLSEVERAARIIYLNKTCFNRLYRVNNAGEFNAPFGKYRNPNIVNEPTLRAVSQYLQSPKIILTACDYAEILARIPKKTFVYLDTPCYPVSATANFTGYVKGGFNRDEQIRLRDCCNNLSKREEVFKIFVSQIRNFREPRLTEMFAMTSPAVQTSFPRQLQSLSSQNIVNESVVLNYALASGIIADFTGDEQSAD